jgi:hypothetical protein
MKDLQWFPPIAPPRAAAAVQVIGPVVVGAAIGGLLLLRGHRLLAIAVWIVALLVALSLRSHLLRRHIVWAAHAVGAVAGRVTTLVVLWPFYVVIFGAIRLTLSIASVDVLDLRLQPGQASYWQPATPEEQRAKYYQRLFTLEPARRGSHFLARSIGTLIFAMALLGSGELILRAMGFGNPIVYRIDPHVGYYPAPNQDVHRYGGKIHINAFGMRSRNVSAQKPAHTFRILMLGDSTLYGGSYIDQGQVYSTRLEELLNHESSALPGSPRQVEVLSMGVNGWGPQHELAYTREFGFFQADLVMMMGPPNDAYRPLYGIEQFPFFAEGHCPIFAWQELWEHLIWRYDLNSRRPGEDLNSNPLEGDFLAAGVAAWLEIAELARGQGARVDFELLPNEEEAREGKASESTQRILDALLPDLARGRIPVAYPLVLFHNNLGVAKLFHDGAHLDTLGHEIYAGYLRARVLQVALAK